MASRVTVKVSGLRELGEAMRGLSDDMNNKIARQATGAAAAPVNKSWKALAHVATKAHKENGVEIPPGTYRDNIVTKKVPASQSKFTSEHIVVVKGGRKNKFASHIAALNEFGTVKMAAHPAARPAFDTQKENAVNAMKYRIASGIAKAKR